MNPTTYNNYAIRWAACFGATEVVRVLLKDNRIDPSAHKNEAIRNASK